MEKVREFFLDFEARIVPLPKQDCVDRLVWYYNKCGRYSVKSGYWVVEFERRRRIEGGLESESR